MAPRGRPAKKGTRMDAALDAMKPYGFPNKLVRQTVSQLLKVYGGNDGWVFIEDSSYTLLIDTLLEKQQQETVPLPQDCLTEDNPGNGPNEASLAGCSNRALLPCSNTEDSNDAPQPTNHAAGTISEASVTGNQLSMMAVDTASPTSKTVNELPIKPIDTSSATSQLINQLSIKAVDTVLATDTNDNQVCVKAEDTVSTDKESGKPRSIKSAATVSATVENDSKVPIKATDNVSVGKESESPQTKSSQPMGRLCNKRRKPCYGWISCDEEEEEEELIELPPGPLANAFYKLVNDQISYG